MSGQDHLPRPAWKLPPRFIGFGSPVDAELLDMLTGDVAAALERGVTFKRCKARWISRVDTAGGAVVLKLFVERSLRHTMKQWFLPSRARRYANRAAQLAAAGFATPMPIAILEERRGPFCGNSCLVYPFIDGPTLADRQQLWRLLRHRLMSQSQSVKQYAVEQLRSVRDRLLQQGLVHTDVHQGNFIFDPEGNLQLLDLDSIRPCRSRRVVHASQERFARLEQFVARSLDAHAA